MKHLRVWLALTLLLSATIAFSKSPESTVVFQVEITCDGCVKRIEKNIAFEKGVKDLQIDKKAQTVKVVYNPEKTNIDQLKQAFANINKPVQAIVKAD